MTATSVSRSRMSLTTSTAFTASTTTSDSSSTIAPPIIVLKSDIMNESKFRPIKDSILAIAAKQIELYKKIGNGQLTVDEEDDDEEVGPEEDEIGKEDSDSDGETDSEPDDSDSEDVIDTGKDDRLLKRYIFGTEELQLLQGKLGSCGGFFLKFELLDGGLIIRTVPGLIHDATAQYLSYHILEWSNIPGQQHDTKFSLTSVGSANYEYRSGPRVHSKQPDCSFISADIQIPPAKPQPKTARIGFAGHAFPTLVVEVAHQHESWALLLQDARQKAFSRQTSVQLVVGIKLFKNDFKVFVAKRGPHGRGMTVLRMTEKLKYNQPTRNAPAHVGDGYRFPLEYYRRFLNRRNLV